MLNWPFSHRRVFGRKTDRSTNKRINMKNFTNSIVAFLKEEDGPTAVEYAVMLALIVVVCLAAVGTIGENSKAKFEEVGTAISSN